MEFINGSLLMRHEHLPCALVELMQIGKTPSGTDPVLEHAPATFHRIEVMAAMSWQAMQPKPLVPVGQRRRQFVCPVDATAVDDHDHLLPGCAEGRHHVMEIWP